jgi:ElaB/YqjD/DUF883 family membrane-anchored ribosome-binding protein
MENPINISEEAKKKFDSSTAHTKAALDATAEAAKHVTESVKKHSKTAFDAGKEHLGAAAKDLGDAASTTVQDLQGQAKTALDEATARAKNFQTQTEDYIRANPLQSIGVAFAAGILFGLLTRR